MKRARLSQTLLAALLASAAAGAAPPANTRGAAAPVAFSGVYWVTFAIHSGSALPPGANLLCKAKAVPNAGSLENFRLQAIPVASGLSTANAAMTRSATAGASATCTVQIPFYWTANNAESGMAQGGAVLSYEIDAVSGPGAAAQTVLRQEGIPAPYPIAGGSTNLRFNVSF